jgi:hypothetical protein
VLPAETAFPAAVVTRDVSLSEEESAQVWDMPKKSRSDFWVEEKRAVRCGIFIPLKK